jgi:uncharacterized protein (TIGR01777 family)
MRVFITGGTGFVGTNLTNQLVQQGHNVTVLTRAIRKDRALPIGASFLEGDPTREGNWQHRVGEHEVIINLAGASIFRRWTRNAKVAMRESRILTTRNLVHALSAREGKETLFLSASAVGYYGFHGDEEVDESSPAGADFLASLSHEWEAEALEADKLGVDVLLCRFGIVLGEGGGALEKMLTPFRWHLGSPLGSGRQWFSWIHQEDLVNIYLFLINQKGISGPINFTAPCPVRNRDLMRILGEVLNKPTFMPNVPGVMLKLSMGEFGSVLLNGQKVLPKRLSEAAFQFEFPDIRGALQNLLTGR